MNFQRTKICQVFYDAKSIRRSPRIKASWPCLSIIHSEKPMFSSFFFSFLALAAENVGVFVRPALSDAPFLYLQTLWLNFMLSKYDIKVVLIHSAFALALCPPPNGIFFWPTARSFSDPTYREKSGQKSTSCGQLVSSWTDQLPAGNRSKSCGKLARKNFRGQNSKNFTQIRSWSKAKILSNQNFSSKLPQMRSEGCCASFEWFWKILKKLTTNLAKKFEKLTNFPPGSWSVFQIFRLTKVRQILRKNFFHSKSFIDLFFIV